MRDTHSHESQLYVHECVALAARRTPRATAVEHAGTALDFAGLDESANRLAQHLRGLEVRPGARAGLCLGRGTAHLIAQLACFKLGVASVLIDPALPAARVTSMLNHAEVAVVLADAHTSAGPDEGIEAPVVLLDGDAWRSAPAEPPGVPVTDSTVCHVAFTSGSTGAPKAVLFRHGALRMLVHTLIEQCAVEPGSRGSWLCSPGAGLVEVDCLPLLAAGAAVCVPEPQVAADPGALRDWLVGERVTHSLMMTATAERCWSLGWPDGTALRNVRVAGERLRAWPPDTLPFEVVNVYGSSEATVVTTCNLTTVSRTLTEDERLHRAPPVGRPVPGVRVHVLDESLTPVPPGEPGELYVSGAGLSLGYLDQPATDEEKFLPNPLPDDPHPVLYRTGDVARRWPDGEIEVIGRADDEVKIRGYRVHLGEVESALARQPGVLQAAVTTTEPADGERRLAGYLVTDPQAPPLPAEIRRALRRTLPAYMVPVTLTVVDEIPVGPGGKVDRAALPAADRGRPGLDVRRVEPRNDMERRLAELWSQVLGLDGIGVLDGFFDLGGDSLSALRLLTRAQEELGLDVTLPELMRAPSVASLARLAAARGAAESASSLADLPPVRPDRAGRYEPFPLTETQQALWIGRGAAVDFGNVGCHGYFEWERDGLDVPRFERAWSDVLRRHDMLRAVVLADGTQRVLPRSAGQEVRVLDLRDDGADAAGERVQRVREEMSHQVLDPHTGPLFDVRVTLLPGGRVRLHIGVDLLVVDAWSLFQVLFPELIELYEDPDAAPPAPEITFRDYVTQARAALEATPAYELSRAYWLARVPDLPAAPDLPLVARPRGEIRFERRAHRLAPARWHRLQERARHLGVTPSGILVAVFAEVLRTWSKNDAFTVNFPVFDRLPVHPDVDRLLGDFTNTLLVAVEKTDGTFAERALDIQEQIWTDLQHRHFNGIRVLRELQRRRPTAGARPAMPIVVTSLLGHPPRRQVSGLGEETYGISQTPQVLLDFQIREIDRTLHLKWDFLDAMFPPGLVDDMFTAYCGLLERLITEEALWQAERFDLVPAGQLAVRAEVNDTARETDETLLHEMLARRAAERPDAPAVVTSGRTLSYAELDSRARRIGRRLRELGARPGALVAIVAEKGWEQYAAVYGVLASGAAHMPVDPSVPPLRLRELLANGEVELVLTQSRLVDALAWPDGVRVLAVDRDFDTVRDAPLASVQGPRDLAYVIHTSGSTGRPKGVMVDHRGVTNMFGDINERFGIGPDDRVLAVSGLHFDASVYDVFGIIAAGGAAVLPDAGERPDPAHWVRLVQRESVTFWNSVPALAQMLVEAAEQVSGAGHAAAPVLGSLRLTVLSGDWIPLNLPDRMRALAPGLRVMGSGGPTETICWSVLQPVGGIDPDWTSIPYGRPMANHRYHVVDGGLRDRPVWVPGEMLVGSDVGLAHGYWRDEERTRERFFRLPSTGERVYATGDLGRYLPDGSIEILGRDDFQVQVNGYRIELAEVEHAARSHPRVEACVVVAPARESRARHLVAFVVGEADGDEVSAHLRERLPGYMVPADVRILDSLPLTGNGKVDRLALTEQARRTAGQAEPDDPDGTPRGPLEALVAAVCAEVLERPGVSVRDDFFLLGGDSLTGTRFAARLGSLLDVPLSVRDVFDLPTCAQLAKGLATDAEHGPRVVAFAEAMAAMAAEDEGHGEGRNQGRNEGRNGEQSTGRGTGRGMRQDAG
ncbi:non-ribosomal peptide synthetase [Streptomyces naphthomycinicus]|uniref:non-ribosomal peptide synthetase n=1 Tax=Streptomyces naphthomycinicus TaxID=2872625 RepID=UPI001CED062F|nr:non-ribosomal peptide synthetase [Streptomyces sp. TML10]